jgi:two-component system, sporulation sensor kinase B
MIVFILLWIIAVIAFALDPRSLVKRWFSSAAFLDGLYGFHFAIQKKAGFWLINHPWLQFSETLLIYGTSFYIFPYAFLMATIYHYTESAAEWKKWRKPSAIILLLPVVMTYGILLFWLKDFNHPRIYQFRNLWVVPYYVAANSLLIASCFRAQSPQRNDSLLTCVIIIPISLSDLIIAYILPIFGIVIKPVGTFLIIILFMSFTCIVTRYGFLGRKLQMEKLYLDHSIKTMTSGAAILNHSIKNEIAKISMCASNLNTVRQDLPQTMESARIILRSASHILKMIERTNQCSRDLVLEKSPIHLKSLLEEILAEFQCQFVEKKIEVTANLGAGDWITVDKLHLWEVINNVIENAIEAMESGGRLDLKVARSRGMVTIIINDTGAGIPAGLLSHVFEPFFTTKNPRRNFGLGLLYCYQVLKKHGGTIKLESEPGKGTTVYLNLPRRLRNRFYLVKGASHVSNKSISG